MTAENRPAFCSDVQQLCSTLSVGFSAATGVSERCGGVSMSMASSSRLGVAACAAAPPRRRFGGIEGAGSRAE